MPSFAEVTSRIRAIPSKRLCCAPRMQRDAHVVERTRRHRAARDRSGGRGAPGERAQ